MIRKYKKYTSPFIKAKMPKVASVDLLPQSLEDAIALHREGQLDSAAAIYRKLLAFEPRNADALHLLGLIELQTSNPQEAALLIKKAIKINSSVANYYSNLASALIELKQFDAAISNCKKALVLKIDFAEAYTNLGLALRELKKFEGAIECYDKAIALSPELAEAYSNRAIVLIELKQFEVALANCNKAIELKPDFANAYCNKGIALQALKQLDAAVVTYDKAIALKPEYAEAYNNKGSVFEGLKRFEEALINYQTALNLNPNIEYLFGTIQHVKMQICNWRDFSENVLKLRLKIQANEKASPCLTVLALNTTLAEQLKAALLWSMDKYPRNSALGPILKRPSKHKIRIGYYSADFYNHATSYLMAELFEKHDKDNFEIIAFSFNSKSNDYMYTRVSKEFDQFIDASYKSDKEVAQISRELSIDIAIDLKGFTKDERLGIFSYRVAPIQVSFLGYPGTLGLNQMDYLIADKTLIPQKSQEFYSEKIIYMPNSYQVNGRDRVIAKTTFSRQELGLPEDAFVFCCFNNNYKINPFIFDSWIKILLAVDKSVLWLLEDNVTASYNLCKEAESRGLSSNRLIFAKRMDMPNHLARHKAANLFLDTLPCNAHTTASDALWVGLPLLTCIGDTFASRVAASLLFSIGLPELVTETYSEYESVAIELAKTPVKLKKIKDKLEKNRLVSPLFNSSLFAKHIELAYKNIYNRYQTGLSPEHIYIDP